MKRLLYLLGFLFVVVCAGVGVASAQPSSQKDSPQLTPTPSGTIPATVISTPFPTCGTGADYVVGAQPSATIVPGLTDVGNHCNDCTTLISLPFAYSLYGQTFNTASVSDNGTLQFVSADASGQNVCLPYGTMSYTIFALWDDLRTDWTTPDPTGIYTSVSAEAGTFVFNIEWRAVYNLNSCCVPVHFEVRLFQGQDRFDIIYQHTDQGGIGTTIGVQRGPGTSYTQYLCNTYNRLPDGTRLTFRPYNCGEATFTPTATSTPTPPTPPPPTSPVRTNTPTYTYTPTISPTPTACTANYVYSEFTASIVPGTVDTGNHCDDCTTAISLPFPVRLYDQTYNSALVNSNGLLHFATPNAFDYVCFPLLQFPYTLAPFWDDLVTDCTGCGIFTSVSGSAPNRIFNVEWRAAPFGGGTGRDFFEIRIYENSPSQRFDFVYSYTVGSANSTIGVQGDNTHWTQYACNDRALAPGLCVIFTLPPCGITTITPTSTRTSTGVPTNTSTNTHTPTASPTCASIWSVITPPPGGTLNYTLQKVAAISPDDIWAVGEWLLSSQTYRMLAMHWDGTQWSIVSTPAAGSDSQFIRGLTAISHNDVWAVGWDTSASKILTVHWDGTQWSHIATPAISAPYAGLYAVSGRASNDVWAVGYTAQSLSPSQTLTMHWNGTAWSIVTSPNSPPEATELYGVAAVSGNDVWAVGGSVNGFIFRAIILHWNGTAWSFYDLGTTQHLDTLYSISAASASDIWAVGVQGLTDVVPSGQTLTMHWNGTAWARVTSPNPVTQGSQFKGVSVLPSGEALAAGYYTEEGTYTWKTLVEKWDGSAWTIQQTPNLGTSNNVLSGIGAVSQGFSWAVGYHSVPGGPDAPLMLRYGNSCGQITVTPTVTPTRTPCPMSFTDVHPTDYFYDAVRYLYCMGAISGYADNTFRPFNDTTRGQLTKIVVLAEQWPINTQGGPHFSDVPTTNPFYAFVETAYNRGIITGYSDGTFRWGANVTRGQLCKIVVIGEGWLLCDYGPLCGVHFTDVPPTNPFYVYIETAYTWHSIISGYADGTFRPYNNATRGQISKVVYSAVTQP